jgi:hypothetical protein
VTALALECSVMRAADIQVNKQPADTALAKPAAERS